MEVRVGNGFAAAPAGRTAQPSHECPRQCPVVADRTPSTPPSDNSRYLFLRMRVNRGSACDGRGDRGDLHGHLSSAWPLDERAYDGRYQVHATLVSSHIDFARRCSRKSSIAAL